MKRTIRVQKRQQRARSPLAGRGRTGLFKDEGLDVEYYEEQSERCRRQGREIFRALEGNAIVGRRARSLSGLRMGRDRTRAATRPWPHHRPRHNGAYRRHHGARGSKIKSLAELRNVPIAVTWHAGTFYAAIEALEAAGVPYNEINLVHANDRLKALLDGETKLPH